MARQYPWLFIGLSMVSTGCAMPAMPFDWFEKEVQEQVGAPIDYSLDSDGDGIPDHWEEELGSDPFDADSDGDGYADGVELDSNTDPTDADDHPYVGGWPIDACRHDVGTGPDIAEDFALIDQFGEEIRLHDFCDHVVLLVGCAGWEGSCGYHDLGYGLMPNQTQGQYETYWDEGLMVVMMLGEDVQQAPPDIAFLNEYADALGITHPVVTDPYFETTFRFVDGEGVGLPSMTLLGRGMEILQEDAWIDDVDIERALGLD